MTKSGCIYYLEYYFTAFEYGKFCVMYVVEKWVVAIFDLMLGSGMGVGLAFWNLVSMCEIIISDFLQLRFRCCLFCCVVLIFCDAGEIRRGASFSFALVSRSQLQRCDFLTSKRVTPLPPPFSFFLLCFSIELDINLAT